MLLATNFANKSMLPKLAALMSARATLTPKLFSRNITISMMPKESTNQSSSKLVVSVSSVPSGDSDSRNDLMREATSCFSMIYSFASPAM